MSIFRVNAVARNPKDESRETPPIEALVDTGSELTWLPADALEVAGITPRRKRTLLTATRQTVTRDVGYAILASEGFETADEVVFAQPSDLTLLGSAQVNHPVERDHLMIASLDHALWFMRPFRADEWLLYDQSSPSACAGRALTQGKIYTQDGEMVAAVMQEGLTRYQRGYSPPAS